MKQFCHQASDWWRIWDDWLYQQLLHGSKPIRIEHLPNEYANKALMHEVLLVPETKSRDTNIPNSINAIIEQDTKTYIQ